MKYSSFFKMLRTAALMGILTSTLSVGMSVSGASPEAEAPEIDINTPNHIETYFTSDAGGWVIDPATDSVKDGALIIKGDPNVPTHNVTHAVELSDVFEVEFRAKTQNPSVGERGFKFELPGRRILMYIRGAAVQITSDNGYVVQVVGDTTEWHVYKLTVDGYKGQLYIDGEFRASFALQPRNSATKVLTLYDLGGALIVDYFKYSAPESSINIVSPKYNESLFEGGKMTLKAECVGGTQTSGDIPYVDYYANDVYIGSGKAEDGYALEWQKLVPGTYSLVAKYGELSSGIRTATVVSSASTSSVVVENDEIRLGESTKVSLKRVPKNTESVTYYANGTELPAAEDKISAVYTANILGKAAITAKIRHNDGSVEWAEESAVFSYTSNTAGVVLQSSYIAQFTAAEGAVLTASDGIYALDMKFGANGVSYTSAEGVKTYKTGLGDYKVQVDGGSAEVYYNGQYAFSFLMPVTTAGNGITAVGVTGLRLGGLNATRYTVMDGTAVMLGDFTRDYAVEWVLDAPRAFAVDMNDGVYNVALNVRDGKLYALTYPNGKMGVVEEDEVCALPEGRHAYRLAVSNGISQLFIDNVWKASLRLPITYSTPYAKTSGTGSVYLRDTNDLYTHSDRFDNSTEYSSDVYWQTHDGVEAEFTDGAMILKPVTEAWDTGNLISTEDFGDEDTTFYGDGFSIQNGIMTITNSDPNKSKNILVDVEDSKDFVFETRMRVTGFGVETGMKLELPANRIMVYFQDKTMSISGKTQGLKLSIDPTVWHTYKFVVKDTDKCEVFVDGESRGTVTLPTKVSNKNVIGFFSKPRTGGTTGFEVDSVKYTRNDVNPGDIDSIHAATLKAYAYNPTVSATICVDEVPADGNGGVYLTVRYQNEYKNLLAGYNFAEDKWEIVRNLGQASVISSAAADFPFGQNVKLDLTVEDKTAVLYVNGERTVSVSLVDFRYYGNVGVAIRGVTAKVSDFSYSGTGRVMPGALSFVTENLSPDILELEDGHLFMTTGSISYESTDSGYTWKKVTNLGKFGNNTIKLKSGTIVYISRKNEGGADNYRNYANVSTDGGKTFEGPYPIQSYLRNRITMNNKLTEGLNGRLLYASGESGHGVEDEGGERVFYSDDEGRTWVAADLIALDGKTIISGDDEARMDIENTGVNFQESKISVLPDGTLRLYHRTDEGFLYYSISTDNGATWTTQMWKSEFISVMSAFNIERDPHTGYYYMAWEYNNANDHPNGQNPRTRVGLAVSYDGMETWEYVGDIYESSMERGSNDNFNIGVRPTKDAVYVTVAHYPITEDGTKLSRNYAVRVDKDTMKTTERFTRVHALMTASPDTISKEILDTMLLARDDGSVVLAGGKIFEPAVPTAGYIPASAVASLIGASEAASGNTATLKYAAMEVVFTAGIASATVNGEAKAMSAAPVMNSDGLYIPVSAISEVFGLSLTTSADGSFVSACDAFTDFGSVDMDKLELYLPSHDTISASEPSTWAAQEINAAIEAGIVPIDIRSAYQKGITRAEFCELIMTMLKKVNGTSDSKMLLEKMNKTYSDGFTDTDNVDIVCANLIGIVNGRGNGIFDPHAGITRQEAAVMLANTAKVLGIKGGTAPVFNDISDAAQWAREAIESVASIVAKTGSAVMGGTGSGTFSPLAPYTREQSVMTVYRLYMSM